MMRSLLSIRRCPCVAFALCVMLLFTLVGNKSEAEPTYAISIYGSEGVNLGPDEPWPYVNPDAPKGGELVMHTMAPFTTLNPLSVKGVPAPGLLNMVIERPCVQSNADKEPFSTYAHLAEKLEVAEDRMSVTYHINPDAAFSDGKPVTADDFVFSFELIDKPQYNLFYKRYFEDVKGVKKIDKHTVKFQFEVRNQELPLIMGQLPIFPEHVYGVEGKEFGNDFSEMVVGSGPYVVEEFEMGNYITYRRNPDWWGKGLPKSQGVYNFDRITYRVYRENVSRKQAFKAGHFDVFQVNASKDWAKDFRGTIVENNYVVRREIEHSRPVGMQGFVFNLRKDMFQNLRVRYAIAMVFNFEWLNEKLFHGQYQRTHSFFGNSDLTDLKPASGELKEFLKALQEKHGKEYVPDRVLSQPLKAPGHDMASSTRKKIANMLLKSAGWKLGEDGVRQKDGKELRFELLLSSKTWERIAEPYRRWLSEIGVDMNVTLAQPADYKKRLDEFRYDMILNVIGQSRSIGNEQFSYYGSKAADDKGGQNVAGLKNPAVDQVLRELVSATTREKLRFYARALDHILTNLTIYIPNWHLTYDRVLYWNKFGMPEKHCSQTLFPYVVRDYWWYDKERARALEKAMKANEPFKAP